MAEPSLAQQAAAQATFLEILRTLSPLDTLARERLIRAAAVFFGVTLELGGDRG